MAILKDVQGTEWELRLTLSVIRKITSKMGVTMAQLTTLDLPIGDVLGCVHLLCEKQLKKEEVTVDAFYDRIDTVPFDELMAILQETLYEAFPKMKKAADEDVPFVLGE